MHVENKDHLLLLEVGHFHPKSTTDRSDEMVSCHSTVGAGRRFPNSSCQKNILTSMPKIYNLGRNYLRKL